MFAAYTKQESTIPPVKSKWVEKNSPGKYAIRLVNIIKATES